MSHITNKYIPHFLFIFSLFLFNGCAQQPADEPYQSNLGSACVQHSDCKTPMEYLIQSNCPFSSACIENTCKVICPLYFHDPNPKISKSYSVACMVDSDCNCTERGEQTKKCVCVSGGCASVEAE